MEDVFRNLKWLPPILDAVRSIVEKHGTMGGSSYDSLLQSLAKHHSNFSLMLNAIGTLPKLPQGMVSSKHIDLWSELQSITAHFRSDLEVWILLHPTLKFAFGKLAPWTATRSSDATEHSNGHLPTTFTILDQQISDTIDSMLVGVQHVQEALNTLPTTADPAWLTRSWTSLTRTVKSFQVDSFSTKLQNVMESLVSIENAESFTAGSARIGAALLILEQYGLSHQQLLDECYRLHRSLCGLLSIVSKSLKQLLLGGFCGPSEKSAEVQEASQKVEDGTGLGDGEGAEDISKDVEDDEDLSELAQAGSKDKEEKIEDNPDAVDMQDDDFEGEFGESSQGSEKESDNEDNGGDEDGDVEDEIGGVDDLDPSAIDEKLWNGPEKTDQKEKTLEKAGEQQKNANRDEASGIAEEQDVEETEVEKSEDVEEDVEDEMETNNQAQVPQAESHPQEEQTLDLPENMDLDEEKGSSASEDAEMDQVSNMDDDNASGSEHQAEDTTGDATAMQLDQIEAQTDDIDEVPEEAQRAGSLAPTDEANEETDDAQLTLPEHQTNPQAETEGAPNLGDREAGNEEEEAKLSVHETEEHAQMDAEEDSDMHNMEVSQQATDGGELGTAKVDAESGAKLPMEEDETQAFKKLGDALEEWHRKARNIHNSSTSEDRNDARPSEPEADHPEYEHLAAEDMMSTTQALGTATEEQSHALDERAMESEVLDLAQPLAPDVPNVGEEDEFDTEMADVGPDNSQQPQSVDLSRQSGVDVNCNPSATPTDKNPDCLEESGIDSVDDGPHAGTEPDGKEVRTYDDAHALWSYYESATRELSLSLTEQLRLILAPTLATKMRGDFRTGKRLNIKKIIPYIASHFKRDKIWMRRSIPSKRSYQIMLAVDDSQSMGEGEGGKMAFEALALISKSLSMLEAGQICVVCFGERIDVAHPFDAPFSSDAGARTLQHFGFNQTRTDVRGLVSRSIDLFQLARAKASSSTSDLWQLELIISDGVCEDHETIRRLVRKAQESRIMIVFVIVDSLKGESIMSMSQATFEPDESGEPKLKIRRYLDDFPFGCYLIVGNLKDLPNVLATALRQWFSEVIESMSP